MERFGRGGEQSNVASKQSTMDFLLDQLSGAGEVTARKMFGEFCLYYSGKPVALVCDDQLFVKPTPGGRELVGTGPEEPPYPGAKPYLLISADLWEDRDWLAEVIRTTAGQLPEPKPRRRKG
jgi:DNA transformation protein and related proteins